MIWQKGGEIGFSNSQLQIRPLIFHIFRRGTESNFLAQIPTKGVVWSVGVVLIQFDQKRDMFFHSFTSCHLNASLSASSYRNVDLDVEYASGNFPNYS